MKSYLIPTLALGWLVSSVNAQDKPDLTNPKQKTSYAIGVNIGSDLKAQAVGQELDLDTKAVIAGFADKLGGKAALTPEEVGDTLAKLSKDLQAKAAAEAAKHADGAKNLKEGEAFLAENAKKEGVKTIASGLQYKALKSGTGASPQKTDTVKVHYHGTLIDGTVFDSSVQRGQPVTFAVGGAGLIPGWVEALQLMKVGDKWQLFIPAKLAYGERAAGPKIGPNSALLFEVEMLGIEK